LEQFKIAIIGGGAAGLISAISALQSGCQSVAIFESNPRCGTKILMSGGSRCNITNESVSPADFYGGNRNFIKNVLNAFSNKSALQLFDSLGLILKRESSGKYFPANDSASGVLDAMLREIRKHSGTIHLSAKVEDIKPCNNGFLISARNNEFMADKVILTTGGMSYPSTGSDGNGYQLARRLGHSIITPFPSLSPLLLNEPELTALSGITIHAKLTLFLDNKKLMDSEQSLLFTHFGLSGPAPLNISREIERLKGADIKLYLNTLPDFSYESMKMFLKEKTGTHPDKQVFSIFREMLPQSLCSALFEVSGVPPDRRFCNLSKAEAKQLTTAFISYELRFTGIKGFKQAEVTAGGVPLTEVKYQTMESKLQNNLFLSGEILDVDGKIGGYNFQWAWSTGYIAGKSVALCP